MKPGDQVRFALWSDLRDFDDWSTTPKKHIGLLVEYDPLMKIAQVLYDGQIHRVRAQLVEKAGQKDFNEAN